MAIIGHVTVQVVEISPSNSKIAHLATQVVEIIVARSAIAHLVVQVVGGTEFSGIYYINPNKSEKHDKYYHDVEKKIPDPTVRLPYIGE